VRRYRTTLRLPDKRRPNSEKPTLSKGVELRAQIDTETVKGLLAVNGGGAVAMMAFLPSILSKPEFWQLTQGILIALLLFPTGMLCALLHNVVLSKYLIDTAHAAWRP
jgi:hypothetical protein